jgi:hypothetical protein
MKGRLSLAFVFAAFALAAGSTLAQAQQVLTGEIPFAFVAGGKAHAPGRYELRVADDQQGIALLPEGRDKGAGTELLAVTRLAMLAGGLTDSRLVFDKVGATYILSEAWFPGEDGYVLHVEKGPHTHETVKLGKKAR